MQRKRKGFAQRKRKGSVQRKRKDSAQRQKLKEQKRYLAKLPSTHINASFYTSINDCLEVLVFTPARTPISAR